MYLIILSFLCFYSVCNAHTVDFDLEDLAQDFVLEKKRIKIPGYPYAFNPSIVRWRGSLLLSFRVIPDRKDPFHSWIGLIWLDENFNPLGKPQRLCTEMAGSSVPSRAEDARLLLVGDKLYMVYSDNKNVQITKGGFRLYLGQIEYDGRKFSLLHDECIVNFEGQDPAKREKNWVPFDYQGELFLAYSLLPHRIFKMLIGKGSCETICSTLCDTNWESKWGELRGGTPGLLLNNKEYLSFFHAMKKMVSKVSNGKEACHYFMGAYTFSSEPPFEIRSMSFEPIVGKGFYHGTFYPRYWGTVHCVFPCGFVFDDTYIWLIYGRQDHEAWGVKLDKQKLLSSLLPVSILK
jgi:predicted GH43/DUF377 family glycosyl hydrolase